MGSYLADAVDDGVRCASEPRRFGSCFTTAVPKMDSAFPLPRTPKPDVPMMDSSNEAIDFPLDNEPCEEVDVSRLVDKQEMKLGRSGSFSCKYH